MPRFMQMIVGTDPASFTQMVMEGETLPSFMQMGVGADPSQLAATKSHT